MNPLYSALLCLDTALFFKTNLTPCYSTKMSCTDHDMFKESKNQAYSMDTIHLIG